MSLQTLFYPKSIAVIGASRKVKTVGNDVVKNLVTQGYTGRILPVNPKTSNLYGKHVFHSIQEISEPVDLAVIAIPAKSVAQAVEEVSNKGAKAVIVISAGFKEAGNNELEQELISICQTHNITLVGPNCLGVLNPEIRMNASFAGIMPKQGNVAFISQSGALCTTILDYALDLHVGFSKFVSTGNKAMIDELALLKYFAKDETTKVIAMYVEQLKNAPELIRTIKQLSHGSNAKPVIVLKSGTTQAGSKAITSHTGSLAGGDQAYQALFDQAGVIRANSVEELFDYIQIFSKNEVTKVDNVTILTNAGGPGVLTTDAVIKSKLKLSKLEESSKYKLKEFLPKAASIHNPIDILGDANGERYQKSLDILVDDSNTDAIITLLTPQTMTEIEKTAHAVVHAHYYGKKPILASFMGQKAVHTGKRIMQEAGVATMAFPESAAKALGVFSRFYQNSQQTPSKVIEFNDVDRVKVKAIISKARESKQLNLPEAQAIEVLKAYNFPMLKSAQASTPQELRKAVEEVNAELFALKIISKDILHKSDVNGVMLNIAKTEVITKAQELVARVSQNSPEAKIEGVLVMEMAPNNGVELILGVSEVKDLGTMIMVGMGGIYVELLKDVAFGYTPLTQQDIFRMINSLKLAPILKGIRGSEPLDIESLINNVARLAQLVTEFPEITQLDINPLLVLPTGSKVLDARISLKQNE